jgi:hypothetical protein
VLPLVHGFWQQRHLALFGRTLTLTLIARRSCKVGGFALDCGLPGPARSGMLVQANF